MKTIAFVSMFTLAASANAQQDTLPTKPAAAVARQSELQEFSDSSADTMRSLIERYSDDLSLLQRSYDARYSTQRIEAIRQFVREWMKRLDHVDFASLKHDGKIDYILLKNEFRHELQSLDHLQIRNQKAAALLSFSEDIVRLHQSRRRNEPIDPRQAANELVKIAGSIKELQAAVGKNDSTADQHAGVHAGLVVADLQRVLSQWYLFYNDYNPEFTWWVKKPYEDVSVALKKYAEFLREKVVAVAKDDLDTIVGQPIGRDALITELQYEMIDFTPQELIEIGRRELSWCHTELKKSSQKLGFGDDWRKALDHVKSLHVAPGKQPELINKLANEAVTFLKERDLVTIPELCQQSWRMTMMSPSRQRVSPYFTGGEVISVSFPTTDMSHSDKLMSMRGNNIHFSRATVHHELIPGHHLQGFMAQRYRPHRRQFRTPFLVEGWALYWEMLLWDLEFPQSHEDRMGMLFWRSHRCARIIFSLKFHLEQMTPNEAIDFLVENVGHERRNATAEVRRSVSGGYGPLYQAAYMLGGLQIRSMYKQLVESGTMSHRQFHDAILRENSIPVKMIRASLTNQPLKPNVPDEWRF